VRAIRCGLHCGVIYCGRYAVIYTTRLKTNDRAPSRAIPFVQSSTLSPVAVMSGSRENTTKAFVPAELQRESSHRPSCWQLLQASPTQHHSRNYVSVWKAHRSREKLPSALESQVSSRCPCPSNERRKSESNAASVRQLSDRAPCLCCGVEDGD